MADFYFKRVLIKDSLIQLNKDIVEAISFIKEAQDNNKVVVESADKIAFSIEEQAKIVNDLFDDFFEELELDKQRRQKRRILEKVFAT